MDNKPITSHQYKKARAYSRSSIISIASVGIIAIFYMLSAFWIGILIGAILVAIEGIVAYKIGAIQTRSRYRLFTKKDLAFYFVLALGLVGISIVLFVNTAFFLLNSRKSTSKNLLIR